MRLLSVCATALIAQAAHAGPPELSLPVDCALGESCFIQNYVDTDPGPDRSDFTCGKLVYDGHKGTDFAVASHIDAIEGVAVLAAAAGQVKAVRDGVDDHFLGAEAKFPEGQDCGNGMVISHGDGWETQYCHLAKGSIAVKPGDAVSAGTVLGRIGMSGRTEFPHLHLSLRHDGKVVDPFEPEPDATCGADPAGQMWTDQIDYTAGGLLQTGFAYGVPDFNAVKWGKAHQARVSPQQGALVLWVHLFGSRPGDQLRMMIEGPGGVFADNTIALDKAQAQVMRAAGRKLVAGKAPAGVYTGTVTLIREGAEIGRMTTETVLTE